MAGVSFDGLASGFSTQEIVTQLMEVERYPLDRLETTRESETTRLQAFSQLDSRLDDLREAVGDMNITSEVRESSIRLSSEDAFSAESNGAGSGSYDVAVAQLAQVQKSISAGYSSQTDDVFGTGTITVGEETITIDDSNNSLIGLADALNELSETTGVHASIINDGSSEGGYHLVLTGEDASATFSASASLEDSEGSAIDFSMTTTRTAQQAVLFVDGIKVVSDTNTVSGVISGVTLNLSEASSMSDPGTAEEGVDSWEWEDPPEYETTLMTVEPDTDALKEKVQTFVSAYNGIMDWIAEGYDEFGSSETTDEDSEASAEESLSSELRGDSTVNLIKRQLQNLLTSVIDTSGSVSSLSQLGIATQKDGSITLNESTLESVMESDFDGVVSLLSGENDVEGVMKKFNSSLLDMTSSSTGMYAQKEESYNSSVGRLDERISRMETLLEKKEELLWSQFYAMELLVSNMNSESNYLSSQIDMWSSMITGD